MITELDEAIKHCKEVAEEKRKEADEWYAGGCSFAQAEGNECLECAKDYEQIAEWLEALKEYRKADRWNYIHSKEDLPKERDWYLGLFKEPDTDFIGLPYICDYVGKVTEGTTTEGWILRHCTDVDNVIDYFRNLICVAWKPLPKSYESEAGV